MFFRGKTAVTNVWILTQSCNKEFFARLFPHLIQLSELNHFVSATFLLKIFMHFLANNKSIESINTNTPKTLW